MSASNQDDEEQSGELDVEIGTLFKSINERTKDL